MQLGGEAEFRFTTKYKIYIKWKASLVPEQGGPQLLEIHYFLNERTAWVSELESDMSREMCQGDDFGGGMQGGLGNLCL